MAAAAEFRGMRGGTGHWTVQNESIEEGWHNSGLWSLTGDAGADMNNVAASQINRSGYEEKRVGRPLRVGNEAIDQEVPKEDENKHRGELHALYEKHRAQEK